MANVPMTKTTLRLPSHLFKAAKILAVQRGCSLQDVLAEALTKYLKGVK